MRLDGEDGEIAVTVACTEATWGCPHCQQRMDIHEWDQGRCRHVDSCQFQTYIVGAIPRVRCPEHGTITVQVA